LAAERPDIEAAILQSQYRAACMVNDREQLVKHQIKQIFQLVGRGHASGYVEQDSQLQRSLFNPLLQLGVDLRQLLGSQFNCGC